MLGDVSQYDIDRRDAKFMEFVDILDGIDGITKFSFGQEDIVRNELLKAIIDRYEKHKYKKK
jgi:phosphate starvation-inducible protein PhoH